MIWARGFVPNRVAEIPEYFVYCGIFPRISWGKISDQIANGVFLEVPINKQRKRIKQ